MVNKMDKRPKILITNDDGINAPGIYHLWKALKDIADITIVAPATEQSAVGLGITLRNPLRIEQVRWENANAWSVSGTPADCVKLSLKVILKEKPDLIVSGINRGSNAGRNVMYSGTVAGTIEGIIQGIPGVAFSCVDYVDTNYQKTETYIPKIINYLLKHPLPIGTLLNVNFPQSDIDIKGFKLSRQGKQFWSEDPIHREHPAEKHSYYWLGAKLVEFEDEHEDSDISFLKQGFISAVPVYVGELTHINCFESTKDHFDDLINKPH